ncbi:MAG: sulfotransferase [Bryobacteraceae bacterium]
MKNKIYCAGLFRTGTNTLYEMFRRSFCSAHEYMLAPSLAAVEHRAAGRWSRAEFQAFARDRDAAGKLDVDSSGLNFAFLDVMMEMHPNGKVILTMRDCYSWLNSCIGAFYRTNGKEHSRHVQRLVSSLDFASDGTMRWTDRRQFKLCLRQMLRTWASVNEYVRRTVPPDRLLVLDTGNLTQAVPEVARFAEIPQRMVDAHHANGGYGIDYLSCFDLAKVEHLVGEKCSVLMTDRYPHHRGWVAPPRDEGVPAPDPDAVRKLFSLDQFEPREI